MIRDIDGKSILYSYSRLEYGSDIFSVYTARDVSALYQTRKEQVHYFSQISLALTLCSVCLLAVVVYVISRRMKHLEKEAAKVCDGDYSAKIQIRGNDEIASLSRQFNRMIDSINHNMADIRQVADNRKLFISDLTHEIRSPLTSIIGYSELLKNVKLTEEQKIQSYAEKIHTDGKYIQQLSESLTQLVLLGSDALHFTNMDLSEFLKQAMGDARDKLASYQIPFEAAIYPKVMKKIEPSLFHSLIFNLLKNACKASPPGSCIQVVLGADRLSVTDHGKGIPLEELERIREPFYQVDNKARSRQENKGLGLGLPLCIKIAECHGWKLILQSKVGEGTTATVFFNREEMYEKA